MHKLTFPALFESLFGWVAVGQGVVSSVAIGHFMFSLQFYYLNMGNTPCGQITTAYKIPLNAVNKDYNNFQMIQYTELFQYPSRYPYILSYLRKNRMLFQDMYFSTSQTKNIVGAGLIREQQYHPVWKRINQIKFKHQVNFQQILFGRPTDAFRKPHAHYKLLNWITQIPNVVKKIFTFNTMNQEGLVIAYLPLWGSLQQPSEIVIDDQIPMKNDTQYYFHLPSNCSVATILLQKVLAKVLGSYQKVRTQTVIELFQCLIGLPVCAQQVGTKDPLAILSHFYKPHYHIASYNKKFQNHQPEYFKFTLQTDADVSIAMWQLLQNPHSFDVVPPGQIIMQLMKVENERQVIRVGYSSKLHKQKTFLRTITPNEQQHLFSGYDFLKLKKGNYLLHIYTKTDNVAVNANLITYSNVPINMTYRKQNYQLSSYKRRMTQNIFLQTNRALEKCLHSDRVYNKFIWDGFRGILAFKNEQAGKVKVVVLIKEEYRRKIKFQHSEMASETLILKPNSRKIISFVKFISTDVGNFYSITISLQKDQTEYGSPMRRPTTNLTSVDYTPNYNNKVEHYDMYDQNSSILGESKQFATPSHKTTH